VLRKAIEKADADVEKAKRDADEKKWRIVADQMKALKVIYLRPVLAWLMANSTLSSQWSTSPRTPAANASKPSRPAQQGRLPNLSVTLTSKPLHASSHAVTKSKGFEKTPSLLPRTQRTLKGMPGHLACARTTKTKSRAFVKKTEFVVWSAGLCFYNRSSSLP
jgi:hypothetical protein